MPFKSRAQQRFLESKGSPLSSGQKSEWASATDFSQLPEKKDGPPVENKPTKMWLRGAVKHPGALTNAAHEHGVSKLQEAEKESHSSNPHIRSRGALGIRFIKKTI